MNSVVEFDRRQQSLPPFPESLQNHAAIDYINNTVLIDQDKVSHPLFQTWLNKAQIINSALEFKPVSLNEIIVMRDKGFRMTVAASGEQVELATRKQAIDLIERAAKAHCSDMHISCKGDHALVEIRVHGDLEQLHLFSSNEDGAALIRAIYQGIATSKDGTFMSLEIQNAQISGEEMRKLGIHSIRMIRGPVHPIANGGQYAVLRFQYLVGDNSTIGLTELGYDDSQLSMIKYLMESTEGLIMLTGPTGSGKTTTLFECLSMIHKINPKRRLITIEDPIEYPMPWAFQFEVQQNKGPADYAHAALRSDPDTLLFSELRDENTTSIALSAALMGRQIWTTLHTSDPYMFVDRMESFDRNLLDRRNYCDHKIIKGIIAQRLVQVLCPHCSMPLNKGMHLLNPYMSKILMAYNRDHSAIRLRGKGCDKCSGGIVGRNAVAEIIITDAKLMTDYLTHGTAIARSNHRQKDGADKSMMSHAMDGIFKGRFDPREVHRRVGIIVGEDMLND